MTKMDRTPQTSGLSRRGQRRRRGVSLLEFVLMMPILLALTLGAVDFGRFAITYITVTNAARSGAAAGCMNSYTPATYPDWEQRVREAIVAELSGQGGFDETKLGFPAPVITNNVGEPRRMRIQVSYPFETIAPWPLVPDNTAIVQSIEMPFIR